MVHAYLLRRPCVVRTNFSRTVDTGAPEALKHHSITARVNMGSRHVQAINQYWSSGRLQDGAMLPRQDLACQELQIPTSVLQLQAAWMPLGTLKHLPEM